MHLVNRMPYADWIAEVGSTTVSGRAGITESLHESPGVWGD
jgi:hypothetical protein